MAFFVFQLVSNRAFQRDLNEFPLGIILSQGADHVIPYSVLLALFQIPFYREVALWLRVVDVGLESCKHVLTELGPGNSIALVPGGATEVLDSCYKDYILTLNRRKQFIKMALDTGYVYIHFPFLLLFVCFVGLFIFIHH